MLYREAYSPAPISPLPNTYFTQMSKSFNQALAAWCRNYDTYPAPGSALISQYMVMPRTPDLPPGQHSLAGGGHVWLLPFRQPILDKDEHLRLAHWQGNIKMRGDELALEATSLVVTGGSHTSTGESLDKYPGGR